MLSISEEAVREIKNAMEEEGLPNSYLRIYVSGVNCSGIQFGLALDDEVREGDEVVDVGGLNVVYEKVLKDYLEGVEISLIDTEFGKRFVIKTSGLDSCGSCGGC
jgi:iron-sulfur cluster assembly accessory protein